MLIDSLPTKAALSLEVTHSRPPRALVLVGPDRPAQSASDERALTGIGTARDQRWPLPDKAGGSLTRRAERSQAVSAREANGKPQLVRKPSDWTAGSRASLVRHGPTKTIFEVFARPDLSLDDVLTLQDFRARLVHGGAAAPTDAGLEMLRGEAVLMALFLVGLAWPVVANPIDGNLR
jgi:hypothetical protein